MIAIGYIRRSKRSEEKTISLDAQRDHIEQYCKRLGFDLRGVVSHDGISGTKRKRFASLDEAIRQNKPKVIVIYNLDRLARDAAGVVDYLKALTRDGIEVHETCGTGKLALNTAVGRMTVGIRSVVDQAYAEFVGEKTRDALALKKERGQRYTNCPPLGFRYVDGLLTRDAEEQKALEVLQRCKAAGLGPRRALKVLRAANYTGRQSVTCIWQAMGRLNDAS